MWDALQLRSRTEERWRTKKEEKKCEWNKPSHFKSLVWRYQPDSKTLYMTTFISIRSASCNDNDNDKYDIRTSVYTVDSLFSWELNARNNNKADRTLTAAAAARSVLVGVVVAVAAATTTTSTGITKTTKYKNPIGQRVRQWNECAHDARGEYTNTSTDISII